MNISFSYCTAMQHICREQEMEMRCAGIWEIFVRWVYCRCTKKSSTFITKTSEMMRFVILLFIHAFFVHSNPVHSLRFWIVVGVVARNSELKFRTNYSVLITSIIIIDNRCFCFLSQNWQFDFRQFVRCCGVCVCERACVDAIVNICVHARAQRNVFNVCCIRKQSQKLLMPYCWRSAAFMFTSLPYVYIM